MNYINSIEFPSFTSLQYLTYLKARIQMASPQALDSTMLSGLTNLIVLDLSYSNFNGINIGTFDSLIQLTSLIINHNEIRYIEDGALSQLPDLKQLHLNSNGIETVSNNVFKSLTELDLSKNPEFPIETLLHTRYLQRLDIQSNEYTTLDPFVFQQTKELRYLYLSNPFIFDCRKKKINCVILGLPILYIFYLSFTSNSIFFASVIVLLYIIYMNHVLYLSTILLILRPEGW